MFEKEGAGIRKNFASEIYQVGAKETKTSILNSLAEKYRNLHLNGYIHIHDLEAYGKVYNCSTPDINNYFLNRRPDAKSISGKILFVFNTFKELIVNLSIYQSGGIGFANFDSEIARLFEKYDISYNCENIVFFEDCLKDMIAWINLTRMRYSREAYYISLNVGLSITQWGRKTTELLLTLFKNAEMTYVRPNIIFKVNKDINSLPTAINYDLYLLALKCTAKRMIPTYLLTDSGVNSGCDPEKLGIMGCRTRVYQNINGEEKTIGRGNIAYITLNLPRLALETKNIDMFFEKLLSLMSNVSFILKDRAMDIIRNDSEYLKFVMDNNLWSDVKKIEDMFTQGTLSFGFIGLAETIEVLTEKNIYKNEDAYRMGLNIIQTMREYVTSLRAKEKLNYSLVASPGEMVSGRFSEIDKKIYNHNIHKKGFYTNSFHVEVDSGISLFEKIRQEAPFHNLCNGGCISYIELQSAPLINYQGIMDAIEYAEMMNISYLGFNYPLDICNDCGLNGTFDICTRCNSSNIKRIRRVSGYLEDLNYFTTGKMAEVKLRRKNI